MPTKLKQPTPTVPNTFPSSPRTRPTRAWTMFLTTLVLLVASMVLAAGIGAAHYSPRDVVGALLHRPWVGDQVVTIVWDLRLPRILMAALVGASLAAAGVAFQCLLRNDLADPYLVGVSSGASVGAEAVLLKHGDEWLHGVAVATAAFASAVAAMTAVYALARRNGRIAVTNLLLGGVIVSAFLGSISTLLLQFGNPSDSFHIINRLMCSLQDATLQQCQGVGLILLAGTATLLGLAQSMNVFAMGEEQAAQLGVDVERFKRTLVVVGSLLTAATVAAVGIIGFVGLVVPHMARRMLGTPNHRRVIPLATVTGALLMVWADTIARSIMPDHELPVGVVTAFLGAPFFCYLLRKKIPTS